MCIQSHGLPIKRMETFLFCFNETSSQLWWLHYKTYRFFSEWHFLLGARYLGKFIICNFISLPRMCFYFFFTMLINFNEMFFSICNGSLLCCFIFSRPVLDAHWDLNHILMIYYVKVKSVLHVL